MNNNVYDVIIIGAGHAGLALSYHLKLFGLKHLVLERGCIGESWRNQRWDSFRLNTTNLLNKLPGDFGSWQDPGAFTSAIEFADSLNAYVDRYELPVNEHTIVKSVSKDADTGIFRIVARLKAGDTKYYARQLVIASGSQNEKKLPGFCAHINTQTLQLHSSEYKSPAKLPEGAVLVVGSAQSGCQIAEDLVDSGRKVYLSTSMVARLPRRYRGKDMIEWLLAAGFFDVRTIDVQDPKLLRSTAPQLTGTSGLTISLQSLAAKGVVIVGRIATVSGNKVTIQPTAADSVRFADECSYNLKNMIDGFINEKNIVAPAADPDVHDFPDTEASCASNITQLDLDENDISSVIWATGFQKDNDYLKPLVGMNAELPGHMNGISNVAGLYFVGLPWLRKRKSGIIHGINEDAEFIAEQVLNKWKLFRIRKEAMSYE